jgi:hypothetical protein
MAKVEDREGNKVAVKVGDYICFKGDRETGGTVTGVSGPYINIHVEEDCEDHMIDYTTSVHQDRCWIE